jgi:oligoribonuclease
MTGLDPAKDALLETAVIITNYDLEIVARGPVTAIRTSEARLAKMDRWNQRTHKASGLLDRVKSEGVTLAEAERQILTFVKRFCYANASPLCGNSIGHDRRFLARHMPLLVAYLNYRIIDVSSIKLLVKQWYDGRYKPPQKPETHRALADIEDSIDELRYYRKHVFVRD